MSTLPDPAAVTTVDDLAALLRALRRRQARQRRDRGPSYEQLAARIGVSTTMIGSYLTGTALPPTDRLDALARALGADPAELDALARARDRLADSRRRSEPVDPSVVRGSVPRELPAAP